MKAVKFAICVFLAIGTLSLSGQEVPIAAWNKKDIKFYFKPFDIPDVYNLNQSPKVYPSNNSQLMSTSRFDSNKLPFFCKWEHKLQSEARIPVRIRLGSIDYVNKLESK